METEDNNTHHLSEPHNLKKNTINEKWIINYGSVLDAKP